MKNHQQAYLCVQRHCLLSLVNNDMSKRAFTQMLQSYQDYLACYNRSKQGNGIYHYSLLGNSFPKTLPNIDKINEASVNKLTQNETLDKAVDTEMSRVFLSKKNSFYTFGFRFGKQLSSHSVNSATVIFPSEHSSLLTSASYFHFLKSGSFI